MRKPTREEREDRIVALQFAASFSSDAGDLVHGAKMIEAYLAAPPEDEA